MNSAAFILANRRRAAEFEKQLCATFSSSSMFSRVSVWSLWPDDELCLTVPNFTHGPAALLPRGRGPGGAREVRRSGQVRDGVFDARLFEGARAKCQVAFENPNGPTVWDLLKEDPDRYIYLAVRHGGGERGQVIRYSSRGHQTGREQRPASPTTTPNATSVTGRALEC